MRLGGRDAKAALDHGHRLAAQQDAFYSSAAWREGPRQPLVDCLDDYLNTLLWLAPDSIEDLRARNGP